MIRFLVQKPINFVRLAGSHLERGKSHVMEGRVVVVEGQLEALEIAIAETKADIVALRHQTGAETGVGDNAPGYSGGFENAGRS